MVTFFIGSCAKNLGDKNCEFAPEHIDAIIKAHLDFVPVERALDANSDPAGIAVQIFNNADFGYYKVVIERPDRRSAAFSEERLAPLRFDKSLSEPMEHFWNEHGEKVCDRGFLKEHSKEILTWCEDNSITLNAKDRIKLLDTKYWQQLRELHQNGQTLMAKIGTRETSDYNEFRALVEKTLKAEKIKLSASEKNAILNAVSWYDENAEKIVARKQNLNAGDLAEITERLDCNADDLADFGYYKQADGSYLTYETSSDLRDAESVPLTGNIHRYFRDEVKPHVEEAWINLEMVKIGYEISFNKYFYRHKPLRNLDKVTADILALEQQADGLISDILGVPVAALSKVE